MATHDQLQSGFIVAADHLVADFALVDFVRYLSEQIAITCDVPAVGILMADEDGLFQYFAASTVQSALVELFQIQAAEGPGFDCFHDGEQVVNSDLATVVARWPEFAPRALIAGYSSVNAIPMRVGDRVIGAVSILDHTNARFGEADARVVQALVDVATIAILEACTVRRADKLSAQLQEALESRVTIEQAKGALSRLRGVDIEQSFTLMRAFSRDQRRPLREIAQAILTDPTGVAGLTNVPPKGEAFRP